MLAKTKGPTSIEAIAAALVPLSHWHKVLAVVGGTSAFAGLLWLKITFSLVEAAWSVLAVAFGFAALGLAGRGGSAGDAALGQDKTLGGRPSTSTVAQARGSSD